MMTTPSAPKVRAVQDADFRAIQQIYAQHVLTGRASFDTTPPTVDEMTARGRAVSGQGLPYLVVEVDGAVAGFAYAAPYRPRRAYRHTVEDSVYVHPNAGRRGVGRALLTQVIADCTAQDYRQMIAVIGDSGNLASIRLHEDCGFRHTGTLAGVGHKFGGWLDVVLMQRQLGDGDRTAPEA